MRTSYCHKGAPHGSPPGFTLVEIAVTILIMGLLLAISVPTIQSLSSSYTLKGNSEAIAGQIRLAREKAIATGTGQPFHFFYNTYNSDYHIHYPSGFVGAKWSLSKGITYYWGAGTLPGQLLTLTPDGRANQSGMIILQDRRGIRDTVSIQTSGLVLNQ
jgi:prepilin-type N-terminal cleavage/methylation domain-containing protein